MRLVVLIVLVVARFAHADTVLATTPRAEAMKLYGQATKMFQDDDFVAAAVTFGQAQSLLGKLDRDATGSVIDKEAHSYRSAALSNQATAYSRAGLLVEAEEAFTALRDQFGNEMAPKDRSEVDEAIAHISERIGTVVLKGVAKDAEVRFDGRLERRSLTAPLRMSEGEHALDVEAKGYRPFVVSLTVVGQHELVEDVALEPLKTPARLRVETAAGSSHVSIDGTPRGDAPVEVTVAPGVHRIVVDSESYLTQTSSVDVNPGERTIVNVAQAHGHAPLGLRIAPSYVASFPLREDTPLGSYNNAIALGLYHDALRIRTLRFGISIDYTPRTLNSLSMGVVATVCPDPLVFGPLAWCPLTLVASYVIGGEETYYASGQARGRGMTAVEYRNGVGFVRLGVGTFVEDYVRKPNLMAGSTFEMLWSFAAELAAGLDL